MGGYLAETEISGPKKPISKPLHAVGCANVILASLRFITSAKELASEVGSPFSCSSNDPKITNSPVQYFLREYLSVDCSWAENRELLLIAADCRLLLSPGELEPPTDGI